MKIITPKEISENPVNPFRIGPLLYELRGLWVEHPKLTFGEILRRAVELEYGENYIYDITDDELLAAIQNYGEMGNI